MKTKAIYTLEWYELDQPIKVGMEREFLFVRDSQPLHFYSGLHSPEDSIPIRCSILSISHPELGDVHEIDTTGLDYTMHLSDGSRFKVEAEESPGHVYDYTVKPTEWTFTVEVEFHPENEQSDL